eukprot:TRINITY_DN7384_c0_g1_i1.p1 TRINITY_DN7384_c0_g1~~TRINITY_DN7384_c0_g1_i1.p1  ORF type:complete len:286 (-),score=63.22 TRINITY_DN7384_c0_g1_i1:142-999(-)
MGNWKQILTDPVKLQLWIKRNIKELSYWVGFIAFILVVYFALSSKDFSFFLTVSGAVQMFGFLIMSFRVFSTRNVSGLSLHTFICCLISFVARLCSILKYEGYLPYDASGDWFYQVVELISFSLSALMVFFISKKFNSSYNWDLDAIKFYYLVPPALILAVLIHPSLNNYTPADIAWTFALYLESVAMFPQIYLFSKRGGEIESYTSHFVASQGLSRLLAFIFWAFSFHELNDAKAKSLAVAPGHVGYGVLISQIIQMILMADFFYHYVRCLNRGIPMTLPTYNV